MRATSVKKQEPVSKRYAKALYELAHERGEVKNIQEDFAGITETLRSDPQLMQALSTYVFSTEDREKLMDELSKKMELHPIVQRFLQLLAAKNRVRLIEQIYLAFREIVDASNGLVRGTVMTVDALTDAETADLSQAFSRKFNKQVVLEPVIDKDILGGLVVKVQGMTFDGSLKTTIRRLKENLERQSL